MTCALSGSASRAGVSRPRSRRSSSLHAHITVEIWRRTSWQIRSCLLSAELSRDILGGQCISRGESHTGPVLSSVGCLCAAFHPILSICPAACCSVRCSLASFLQVACGCPTLSFHRLSRWWLALRAPQRRFVAASIRSPDCGACGSRQHRVERHPSYA